MAFALLGLAILAVWWPRSAWPSAMPVPLWSLLLAAALAVGVAGGVLAPVALFALGALALAAFLSSHAKGRWQAVVGTPLVLLLSLSLALHLVPGFRSLPIVEGVRMTPDALPFTLHASFDKASAGLLLLALCCRRVSSRNEARRVARSSLPIMVGATVATIGSAWAVGYVRPEFKMSGFTPAFLVINLLFTCVAEEAFFRGLIQERLIRVCSARHHPGWVPAAASAGLFACAHAGGGVVYAALAGIAGSGYALAYQRTRRIEAAVLAHYCVNVVHFVFFTYPGLAR